MWTTIVSFHLPTCRPMMYDQLRLGLNKLSTRKQVLIKMLVTFMVLFSPKFQYPLGREMSEWLLVLGSRSIDRSIAENKSCRFWLFPLHITSGFFVVAKTEHIFLVNYFLVCFCFCFFLIQTLKSWVDDPLLVQGLGNRNINFLSISEKNVTQFAYFKTKILKPN